MKLIDLINKLYEIRTSGISDLRLELEMERPRTISRAQANQIMYHLNIAYVHLDAADAIAKEHREEP